MTAIGEMLRRERLRRNLDLDSVSRELKISPKMLSAIEEEQFDRLPGGVFAKAFVRQYAHLLGLDEEEMATEVQRILQPAAEASASGGGDKPLAPAIQVPRVEKWETLGDTPFQWSSPLTALALVVVVMMGCAGVYSLWQRSRRSAQPHESAAVLAKTTAAQQQPPPAPAAQPPTQEPAAAQPPADQPPAQTPPTETATAQPAASAEPGKETAANAAAPAVDRTGAAAAPNPNAAVRVELVADEPVWVSARADGKYLFSGTLEANQTRTVEANDKLLLRVGNAGGIHITLNGKAIGNIGPKGQIRTIQLTPGGFEIVAVPKAPSDPLELR